MHWVRMSASCLIQKSYLTLTSDPAKKDVIEQSAILETVSCRKPNLELVKDINESDTRIKFEHIEK